MVTIDVMKLTQTLKDVIVVNLILLSDKLTDTNDHRRTFNIRGINLVSKGGKSLAYLFFGESKEYRNVPIGGEDAEKSMETCVDRLSNPEGVKDGLRKERLKRLRLARCPIADNLFDETNELWVGLDVTLFA